MMPLSMMYAFIGIFFFLLVVLIAARVFITRQKAEESENVPTIHASGIYSIVRRSPQDTIGDFKPDTDAVRQYLSSTNEDLTGKELSENEKKKLADSWDAILEKNIREIEAGDCQGIEFYYYDFADEDPVCKEFVKEGHFVTREEIFRYPQIIPPFHIGCTCSLKAHYGSEDIRDTARIGMRPFFKDQDQPPLPDWKNIIKIS